MVTLPVLNSNKMAATRKHKTATATTTICLMTIIASTTITTITTMGTTTIITITLLTMALEDTIITAGALGVDITMARAGALIRI